jgi:SAM-dependent methyltransferase
MDSRSGNSLSRDQFDAVTRWTESDLRGKRILDVGCGAGRFSEVALSLGAEVVALDMSDAVDACRRNLADRYPTALHLVQASLYNMPFAPETFDAVFSIGVLQHTPDPPEALRQVARQAKAGGKIAVWIYELSWRSFLGCNAWKYGLRPLTRLLGFRTNYVFAWFLCLLLFPIWYPFLAIGRIGKPVLFLLPVAAKNYVGVRMGFRDCLRCVVLDTFDWYSPKYDRPQRLSTILDVLAKERCGDLRRTAKGVGVTGSRQ